MWFCGGSNQKEHAFKHHRAMASQSPPSIILQLRITVLEMAVMGQLGINGNAKIVKGKKKNKPCQGKNLQ